MKPLLWNTKGLRSKVKSPINKEEITFTCCQGPVLQKDWCSHIKSAPWKVLLKQHECQLYRWFFFSIMFHFRACSAVLLRYWYWDFFCVLVWSFKKKSVFVNFCFSCPPSVFLFTATGFVVHFLLSAPSFNMQGFLLTGTEARKWEMTYTV